MTGKPKQEPSLQETSTPSRYFVGAFAKGLSVLRAFGEGAGSLTLSQVAERTGLSRPGARRYLLTLQDLGYAAQTGRYFSLTPKVLSLGYAYLSSMPLWLFAEPILERLMIDVGETCSISVLDDTHVVFVLIAPVHRVLSTGVRPGSRLPAYCSSMGRMLLSGLSTDRLESYLARVELRPFTERTITSAQALRDTIAEVKRRDYAIVIGEMEESLCGLSVPIRDTRGRMLAALNTSVNRVGCDEQTMIEELLPKLRRAAAEINTSIAIGDQPTS